MAGVGIGIGGPAVSTAGAAWSPVALGGKLVAWYDPYDLSTLSQDSAGLVPVTADGQPVGRMADKSGSNTHATQPSAMSRPVFRSADGRRWLEFDGIDDFFAIPTTGIDNGGFVMGIQDFGPPNTKALLGRGTAGYLAVISASRHIGLNAGSSNPLVDTPTTFSVATRRAIRINKNGGFLSVRDNLSATEHTNSVAGGATGLTAATGLFSFSGASPSITPALRCYFLLLCDANLDSEEDSASLSYAFHKTEGGA